MIRELIQQIEMEKLAEEFPALRDDPYSHMMKMAFFDELEQIKEAGAFREALKRGLGKITGQGAEAAAQVAKKAPKPRVSWTANLQPTIDPATLQAQRLHAAGQASQQLARQQQLASAARL